MIKQKKTMVRLPSGEGSASPEGFFAVRFSVRNQMHNCTDS